MQISSLTILLRRKGSRGERVHHAEEERTLVLGYTSSYKESNVVRKVENMRMGGYSDEDGKFKRNMCFSEKKREREKPLLITAKRGENGGPLFHSPARRRGKKKRFVSPPGQTKKKKKRPFAALEKRRKGEKGTLALIIHSERNDQVGCAGEEKKKKPWVSTVCGEKKRGRIAPYYPAKGKSRWELNAASASLKRKEEKRGGGGCHPLFHRLKKKRKKGHSLLFCETLK